MSGPVRVTGFEEALRRTAGEGEDAVCLVSYEGVTTVACLTPFGPSVRPRRDEDGTYLVGVAGQSLATGKHVLVGCSPGELDRVAHRLARHGLSVETTVPDGVAPHDALDAFGRERLPVPTVRDGRGRERASSWTLAPAADGGFSRGDVLTLELDVTAGGHVARWKGADGRDAGIHVEIAREPTYAEKDVVGREEATVRQAVYGSMPSPSGPVTVQTLVLDVSGDLARSFPDGRLPRHGGVGVAR